MNILKPYKRLWINTWSEINIVTRDRSPSVLFLSLFPAVMRVVRYISAPCTTLCFLRVFLFARLRSSWSSKRRLVMFSAWTADKCWTKGSSGRKEIEGVLERREVTVLVVSLWITTSTLLFELLPLIFSPLASVASLLAWLKVQFYPNNTELSHDLGWRRELLCV